MKYILDFKNGTTDDQINYYVQSNNLTIVKTFNHFDRTYLVSGDVVPPKTDILDHIVEDHDHGVSLLDTDILPENYEIDNLSITDEKNWWKVAVLDNVNFDAETQEIKKIGSRVSVYLVDSGVNINHPEFDTTRVQNLFSFTGDFTDTKGHGTALASVITGKTCGITNATVKSVKIFDINVSTKQSDILSALDAIIVDYIQNNSKFSIVNLSWTIAKNDFIENKINYLTSLGLIVLCAAGNSGLPISDVTPASMQDVIKVGSFNQNFEPCNFSDYEGGSHLTITTGEVNYSETSLKNLFGWAPGELIYTATKDGGYGYTAGTSISCAIASAILANNSDLTLTNDGKVGSYLHTSFNSTYIMAYNFYEKIFSRNNILNLSEKYASNPNKVATLKTKYVFTMDDVNNEIRYIGFYNKPFKIQLYDRALFNKIEYSNLPEQFTIDNGYMYGTVENLENQISKQFSIPLKLSNNDTNLTDVTVTLTFGESLESLKNNNTIISSVNPTIDITLLNDAYCTYNNGTFACEETATGCGFACASSCSDSPPGYFDYTFECSGGSKATCCCTCCCGPLVPSGCSVITTPSCF